MIKLRWLTYESGEVVTIFHGNKTVGTVMKRSVLEYQDEAGVWQVIPTESIPFENWYVPPPVEEVTQTGVMSKLLALVEKYRGNKNETISHS